MIGKWSSVPLGKIVTMQRGFDLPSSQRLEGDVPIVSSSGVTGTHAVAKVAAPGVITGRYGTLGRVSWLDQDFWPLNTTLFATDFHGNDPKFIYYLLQTIDYQSLNDKSSVPGINRNHLHELHVTVPSDAAEQRAIANTLGTLDDKIELNRQMNRTLDEIAHTLFTSWFVDFDPVRAKAEGRQPEGMDAETATLFPDRFVDSVLGPIPEGWEVKTLGEVFEFNPRRTLPKGSTASFLEMKNVATEGHRPLAVAKKLVAGGARFQNGDTLLARITPCLENGKTAYVDFMDEGEVGFGSTEYIVMRPKPPLPSIWAYIVARDEAFRTFAMQNMTGTSGRQRVSADSLQPYQVAVPPGCAASAFEALVQPWLDLVRANDEESKTLAEVRDTLLPVLLSGRVQAPIASEI